MPVCITIVHAAQWTPTNKEFGITLQQLHRRDSVRCAIEETQRDVSATELLHFLSATKARLLARHLLLCQLRSEGTFPHPSPPQKSNFFIPLSERGKPLLHSYYGGDMSVSHVCEWACCAVCPSGPIGVDIAAVQLDDDALFWSILSPIEMAILEKQPPSQRPLLFALFWSLKESVLKALGLGFSSLLDLPDLTLALGDTDVMRCVEEADLSTSVTTALRSLTVSWKGNASQKWRFSSVKVAGQETYLFTVVLPLAEVDDRVRWKLESINSVLNC